uniref:Uncharacterized protein n=1 Tax=Piliocolobus tephrosceles TaxID=591936 RepID=A0A8C9LM44_9PRIM
MPVTLLDTEAGGWLELRSSRRQQGKTLSLQKIQKLAGCGGKYLYSRLLWGLRQEDGLNPVGQGCGELRSCHCTPAWVTEPHPLFLGCEASWRYRYPSLQCCCQPFLWKPNGYHRGGVGQGERGLNQQGAGLRTHSVQTLSAFRMCLSRAV